MNWRFNQQSVARICPCFLLLLFNACSAAPPSDAHASLPQHWAAQIDVLNQQCTPINAEYRNVGERFDESGGVVLDGLLGEFVFSRYLQEGKVAQSVEVKSDTNTGLLSAKLVGDSSRTVRFHVTCDAGWHVVSFTRAGNYLGEGVIEEQFEQISFFRLDRKGKLVAGVKMKGEFKSMYLFESAAQAEGWYRFEPLN